MAYVQPNRLLPPTSRVIRPYQCSFICTEGPNILGKLNMSGVEIPYYSQFSTRMILNPGATKQPLLYGFLGTEVTFILLKFTYDETNPACNIEEDQFIEYYYADQPSIIRYANKLLLLTGNSTNRIPQIFLNNPSDVKVYVDALVANLEQDDVNLDDVNYVTISNIYYNSVLSDLVLINCDTSGSTQLQVLGVDGYIQLYLDYIDILTIEPQYVTNEIKLTTVSDTTIILGFLSQFEMYQALSRISWVIKDPSCRYLTRDYPGLDILPPIFQMNPDRPSPIPNPIPYTDFATGSTILPRDIIDFFVTGVTDLRDDEISVDSVNITIRKQGSVEPLTGITVVGVYDIVLSVSDIANNTAVLNYTILVDNVAPTISFVSPTCIGTGFTMNETDMALPSVGITSIDIINKSVDYVYDVVDGFIDKYLTVILINDPISGITPMSAITTPGTYVLIYMVEDSAGNTYTTGKTMTYEGVKILDGGENYTIPAGMLSMNFKYVGESGVTGTTVTISGKTFSVTNVSGITSGMTTGVTEVLIWDSVGSDSGGTYYHDFGTGATDTFTFEVNDTLFTITFTGRASLNFILTNDGPVIDHFDISPTGFTFGYDSGITEVFSISTNLYWSVDQSPSWIDLSDLSGTGSEVVLATTNDINITGYPRSGLTSVTVASGLSTKTIDLVMTQETEFYFNISSSALTYTSNSGATNTFDIVTNANWMIYDSVDWLDISIYSGSGDATIVTTATENTTGYPRSYRLFLVADINTFHEVKDIMVIQEA